MDELLLRELTPAVIGVLVHRGVDFAMAEDAVQEALIQAALTWPDRRPADPKGWLVTVAWRKFVDAHRSEVSRRDREQRVEVETAARTDRDRRRRVAALLPVRPSVADPGVRGGTHAARRRWLDYPADRAGLPRAGGDNGATDQPGQTHGR